MRFRALVISLCLLGWVGTSQAQVPVLQCETQVSDLYTPLVQDQLVPAVDGWAPQLLALATQVRLDRTAYDIKRQQAELAERNIAGLLEQIRQLRLQQQALLADVERLKAAAPSPQN